MTSIKSNLSYKTKPLSVCFDLDGTLVDTAPDLIRVLNIVINDVGLSDTDYKTARKEIGFGSRALIKNALKRQNSYLSETLCDELQQKFLKLYASDIAQKSTPFDGVIEVLTGLKRRGYDLSVCTNKPGYLAKPLLEYLDMTKYFTTIIGSDDIVRNKPFADHIFACAGHSDTQRIVMVGDGPPDTLAAKAANVPSVVVNYGYSTIPFYQLGGDIILSRFRQLPSALVKLTQS